MFAENSVFTKVIFFIFLTIFVSLGLYKLTYFGLEYDEVLFVNAALGDLDGITFVYRKFLGIPIMTYSYIGALKSWIFAPIFKLFGVSTLSVRLPMLFLAIVNLLLVYRLVGRNTNLQFALFFFVLLSVDVTFLTLQRFDKGPSAIETCIKLLIMLIASNPAFSWKKKGFSVLFLMAVGVFNKLNFIWFSNAVFGVYFLQNISVLFSFFKKDISLKELFSSKLIKSSIAYLLFLVLFFTSLKLIYVSPKSDLSLSIISGRSIQFLTDLKYALMHRNLFNVFGWTYVSSFWNFVTNSLIVTTIAMNVWLYSTGNIKYKSTHTQVILLVALLGMQYIITPDAQKLWHVFVLFPMVMFTILHTIWLFAGKVKKKKLIFIPVFSLIFIGNIFATQLFYHKINNGECVTEIFIPETKEVEAYLSKQQPTIVLTTDWGIHTQMQGIFHDKHRFIEPFRMFRYPKLFDEWWSVEKEILAKQKEFVILQPVGTDIQKTPKYDYNVTFEEKWTDDFLIFIEKENIKVTKEEVVKNKCGNRLFIIYKAKFNNSDTSVESK